jgi:hypothetical protein
MEMEMPWYIAKRPEMGLDAASKSEFERLFAEVVERGDGVEIEYDIAEPRWKFLCYLCDVKDVVLHGSGNGEITEFEPRQPLDEGVFSGQKAVFAASDGLWPMYFAIANRDPGGGVTSLVNACFRLVAADGDVSEPYYYLSINADAFEKGDMWREGWVYVLPKATFVSNPRDDYKGQEAEIEQWASPVEVKPIAKIRVGPRDFPLLDQVRGHDVNVLVERMRRNPDGFPWVE